MEKLTSIIIPTYNERDNVIPLVERIDKALQGFKYQIVFVDDSSKDGTADAARALSQKYPVKVLVRANKRGLATAIIDGIDYADGEILGVMDADLQHPPEVLLNLLKEINAGKDMVIASRYVPGGGCENWRLTRRIISRGAIALSHIFLPQTRSVSDPVSGFFMFKRGLISNVKLDPTGYKIMLEVFMMTEQKNISEVPYVFVTRLRGKSKLSFKQERDYLKHLLSLMRRKGELTRFIKFALVGASGVIVNEGLLWVLKEFVALPLNTASIVAIGASIVSNFILNDIFTFRDRRVSGSKQFMSRGLRFILVSIIGVVINNRTLVFLTNVIGIHYLVSNLVGIALATMWNYLVNLWWTWK